MKNSRRIPAPGIKWKVFGYFVLFVGVLVVLLWLFQIVFLESFYKAIKTQNIQSAAASIADNLDSADFEDLLASTARQNEMCVRIFSADGKELYDADVMPGCMIHHMSPAQIIRFYNAAKTENGTAFELMEDEFQNTGLEAGKGGFAGLVPPPGVRNREQSMVYATLAQTADGETVLILLNTLITPVTSTVETLRVQLVWITVILLILSAAIALLLSFKIARPIIRVNDAAKKLAQGNYEPLKGAGGYREIKELGETLDYASAELEKVEALRRELIANVSHDLRTPLTMITGYAEMMRDIPGENTPENVQIIVDEANRLSTLVSDILDLSRLQSGARKPQPEVFSLTQDIRDTLVRYNKLTGAEGYKIEFECGGEAFVNADRTGISQVLYNLVNNAVAYTGEDRRVMIRQTLKDGWVRVEVSDTGEGIDDENLPYIWDRYYKGKGPHKRAVIGTGLGLSIARTVLDAHRARYGVVSEKGKGSTFWFELPVAEENG